MIHIKKIITPFTLLLLSYLPTHAQSLKQYEVKRTTRLIVIDGLLNDSAWAQASYTEEYISLKGNRSSTSTKAQIVWDSNYLYLAFTVEDNSIWSTIKSRDGELWTQDVVEVFIDPDGDGLNYIELGFSPNGNMYDFIISKALFEGGKINTEWNMEGILCKSKVNGKINSDGQATGWTCEVAIPFGVILNSSASINKPNIQDNWRINFCRVDFDYKKNESARFSTWNFTNGLSFHVPSRFGKIIFSGTNVNEKK